MLGLALQLEERRGSRAEAQEGAAQQRWGGGGGEKKQLASVLERLAQLQSENCDLREQAASRAQVRAKNYSHVYIESSKRIVFDNIVRHKNLTAPLLKIAGSSTYMDGPFIEQAARIIRLPRRRCLGVHV